MKSFKLSPGADLVSYDVGEAYRETELPRLSERELVCIGHQCYNTAMRPLQEKFQARCVCNTLSKAGNVRRAIAEDVDLPNTWAQLICQPHL